MNYLSKSWKSAIIVLSLTVALKAGVMVLEKSTAVKKFCEDHNIEDASKILRDVINKL